MKQTKTHRYVCRRLIVAILIALSFSSVAAHADLVIDLPDVTIFSDNVNPVMGIFEVFLTLTGPDLSSPPQIAAFNVDFVISSDSGLTFSAAEAATTNPLFVGPTFTSLGTATHPHAAHDAPGDVTALNNAGLTRIPFTVVGGNVGTTYVLTNTALTTLVDPIGDEYAVTRLNGSITVAAIPEAAAWHSLSLVGLICAMAMSVTYFVKRFAHMCPKAWRWTRKITVA